MARPPIHESQKAAAINSAGIWQALFGTAPPNETVFVNHTLRFDNLGQKAYAVHIFDANKPFADAYKNANGKLLEYKLIRDIFKNLDLPQQPPAQKANWVKRFDGAELLAFVLTRPNVQAALQQKAKPFVNAILDGKEVNYGTDLDDQPYLDDLPPTGINMDMLPDIPEDLPAGTAVGTLSAIDATENDTHIFELTNAPGSVPFSIDGDKIIYNGTDVDDDTDYVLNIRVTDAAHNVSETTFPVSIKVTDEDELPPIPVVPGAMVMGDEEDDLFTGFVSDNLNTLSGAFIDGKDGDEDKLKVIVDLSERLDTKVDLYAEGSKLLGYGREFNSVGAFHSENVEIFELKQFGDSSKELAVDLGGMGADLKKIISDSAQDDMIAFTNIAEADGLRVEIKHTQADHLLDFKKGSLDGTEKVTIAVDHVGATRDALPDFKHETEDKRDPGYKGIKIELTEAATTDEHGKLADIKEVALEFNGDQPSVISGIHAGETLDTISGSGSADAVVGSFHHTLFWKNPNLQNVDMSGTSGDNSYVVTWENKHDDSNWRSDDEWRDDSGRIGEHSVWKVPVYDDHGHPVGHEDLTFNGGSGDENLYLGRGAVGLTADGGGGSNAVIFSDLPVGQDNQFSNFQIAKIYDEVGSRAMFTGDPNSKWFGDRVEPVSFDMDSAWVDILDANAIKGIYTVDFACGIECHYPKHRVEELVRPVIEVPDGYDDSPYQERSFSNLALINLEANQEYTFIFGNGDHVVHDSHEGIGTVLEEPNGDGKEKEHLPRYWGEMENRDRFKPWQEGKAVTLVVDVGVLDTEGNTNAGNGTNDVLNLVLEEDLDINFVGGETEVLNVEAATYDGWGRHHINFIKKDVEKTATGRTEDDGSPWLDEHGNQVFDYENKIKGQVDHAEDLHTINLTGEADYLAITGEKAALTPNLTLIDASGTTGGTRLFVDGVGSQPEGMRVEGTANDDIIRGTEAGDELNGNDGDDELIGRGGDDHLDGGEGNDFVSGGAGSDVVDGGADADWLEGGGDATPTIKELQISNVGNGDEFSLEIRAHGHAVHVEYTFDPLWAIRHDLPSWKLKEMTGWDDSKMADWGMDDFLKLPGHLHQEIKDKAALYGLKQAIQEAFYKPEHEKIAGEFDVDIDAHHQLFISKTSGLDFEIVNVTAKDGKENDDHPNMEILVLEDDHYDYGDSIHFAIDLGDGVAPIAVTQASPDHSKPPVIVEGNIAHVWYKVDSHDGESQHEVTEGISQLLHDYLIGGATQYVPYPYALMGSEVVQTKEGDWVVKITDGGPFKVVKDQYGNIIKLDRDLIRESYTEDARAHISFHFPEKIFKSPEFSLKVLFGEPGSQTQITLDHAPGALAAVFDELGYPNVHFIREGDTTYVFDGEHEVGKLTIKTYEGRTWVDLEGPADGSPFANTVAAESMTVNVAYFDEEKGVKEVKELPVDKWLDVEDNSNPWVDRVINNNDQKLEVEHIQDGQVDGKDWFIISEEDPNPVNTHADPFKPGDEQGLVDMIKDFVTNYAEHHYSQDSDPKNDVVADDIDFEGFDDEAILGETFASIDAPTADNYLKALEAAQLQHSILPELVYIASSYADANSDTGFSTAVFAFDNTDTGNDLNTPDSAVILVGVGAGEVTAEDIIADHNLVA